MNTDLQCREIGGNFWLQAKQLSQSSERLSKNFFTSKYTDVFYTSSGRGATALLLAQCDWTRKVVLLPDFTCHSVITPFINKGFEVHFYKVQDGLEVDLNHLEELRLKHNPSILYLQSYFGFNTLNGINKYIEEIKGKSDITVVEDVTHSILSTFSFTNSDYYIGSLRKWLEIPDGGLIFSTTHMINYQDIVPSQANSVIDLFVEASLLKTEYFEKPNPVVKEEFRSKFYKAESILDKQSDAYEMSNISKGIIKNTDFSAVKLKRINNYNHLYNHINGYDDCRPLFSPVSSFLVPLYFPILCRDRDSVQKKLAENGIYAPVLWPLSKNISIDTHTFSYTLYEELLSIPCDQRYTISDMERIINVINT